MQNKETVPAGVAFAIFGVLGLLIVAAFVFAGWAIIRHRNDNASAILALGKTAQPVADYDAHAESYLDPYAILVEAHGQRVFFEHNPVLIDYRTFVPVRGVFEAMGYFENWDEYTETAIFSNGRNIAIIEMNDYNFTVNGWVHRFDEPPQYIDGVPMFPIGPVVSSLGYGVHFDIFSNMISVFHRPLPTPVPIIAPAPTPTPTPRPRVATTPAHTPEPAVEEVTMPCHYCHGAATVLCAPCDGAGGGRGTPIGGIQHEVADASDVWWCANCGGGGEVTCTPCEGTGLLTVLN